MKKEQTISGLIKKDKKQKKPPIARNNNPLSPELRSQSASKMSTPNKWQKKNDNFLTANTMATMQTMQSAQDTGRRPPLS